MPFPGQTQAQSLQDLDNEQDMYDDHDQDFIENDEQGYKESDEEGCQETPDCLRTASTMLLRELHDQIENTNSEQYFEETSSHLENTESDVEEELAHIGISPLDYNPSQITQEEWHPDNVKETTHEPYMQTECHNNHEELFEIEEDQEKIENPQIFPANSSEDSLKEAQEDIQPQNQSSQETENCCTLIQRNIKTSSPFTEKEIDQTINKQP